jgi:sec-independent protein translocase protein TatB
MFDLGCPEILMIVIVALVVLGPKRMPQLVRQVGRWAGKARAMARQFREQLESEVDLADLAESTKNSPASHSTPAPIPELTGAPMAGSESSSDQSSTYPYSSYPYAEAPATESKPAAAPQPGDDTYSHAHAAGDAPMPYLPPEAEGVDAAPPPVALNAPLHPDHAAPIGEDQSMAANHPAGQHKDSSAA